MVIAWGDGRLREDQTPFSASGSASGSPGPAGRREEGSRRPSRFGEKDTPSLSWVNHTCQPRAPQVTRRPGKGLGRRVLWCGGRGEAGNPFLTPATSHCQGGTSGEPAWVPAARPAPSTSPDLCSQEDTPSICWGTPSREASPEEPACWALAVRSHTEPGRPSRAGERNRLQVTLPGWERGGPRGRGLERGRGGAARGLGSAALSGKMRYFPGNFF